MPTFFSTVEVEGVEFHGKASRSKKQADHDAAKIAYIGLKVCGLDMYASFSSSTKANMALQSTRKSDIAKSKQILNSESDDQLLDREILHTDIKVNYGKRNGSFPLSPAKKIKISPSSSHDKHPPVSVSESNKGKASNRSSYLLGNRFKVYTSFPNIKFPEGITIVPIGEDKWIATSLECPNDKDVNSG